MGNKFIAAFLVLEFSLLYLGGALENMILGTVGACLLIGMAVITIITKKTK